MENERMNINLAPGQEKAEIIIRETNHVNEQLPILEPEKLVVCGTIGTIAEFLTKRWNLKDQINHERTFIRVDRDNMRMELVTNEDDARHTQSIVGRLQYSRQYKEFGLNTDREWDPVELGMFFKMNRTYFDSKEENMNLVTKMKSFKTTVAVEVEREQKENGSFKDNYSAVVDSTLPGSFFIKIPVFKGSNPERIEVEIYAKVSGRDISLFLMSSDAVSLMEDVRDKKIDEQIAKIREIAPEIPIFEI